MLRILVHKRKPSKFISISSFSTKTSFPVATISPYAANFFNVESLNNKNTLQYEKGRKIKLDQPWNNLILKKKQDPENSILFSELMINKLLGNNFQAWKKNQEPKLARIRNSLPKSLDRSIYDNKKRTLKLSTIAKHLLAADERLFMQLMIELADVEWESLPLSFRKLIHRRINFHLPTMSGVNIAKLIVVTDILGHRFWLKRSRVVNPVKSSRPVRLDDFLSQKLITLLQNPTILTQEDLSAVLFAYHQLSASITLSLAEKEILISSVEPKLHEMSLRQLLNTVEGIYALDLKKNNYFQYAPQLLSSIQKSISFVIQNIPIELLEKSLGILLSSKLIDTKQFEKMFLLRLDDHFPTLAKVESSPFTWKSLATLKLRLCALLRMKIQNIPKHHLSEIFQNLTDYCHSYYAPSAYTWFPRLTEIGVEWLRLPPNFQRRIHSTMLQSLHSPAVIESPLKMTNFIINSTLLDDKAFHNPQIYSLLVEQTKKKEESDRLKFGSTFIDHLLKLTPSKQYTSAIVTMILSFSLDNQSLIRLLQWCNRAGIIYSNLPKQAKSALLLSFTKYFEYSEEYISLLSAFQLKWHDNQTMKQQFFQEILNNKITSNTIPKFNDNTLSKNDEKYYSQKSIQFTNLIECLCHGGLSVDDLSIPVRIAIANDLEKLHSYFLPTDLEIIRISLIKMGVSGRR